MRGAGRADTVAAVEVSPPGAPSPQPVTDDAPRSLNSRRSPGAGSREPGALLVGDGSRDWLTVGFVRSVLVVVRTTTTLYRLLDVVSLVAADRRVQVVFTHDASSPARLGSDVEAALRELGAPVVAWDEAVETRFDLAVAASENDRLEALCAPVLLLPHGAGHQKTYPNSSIISGLNPQRLVVDGRVVPTVIAVPHSAHLDRLADVCPPAADRGLVVGDPTLARILAMRHRTDQARAAFGARYRRLVLLTSTFGPDSAFGRHPDLPERLAAELPVDEYRVVVALHPGVWSAHRPWQVRSWLARAEHNGVAVVAGPDAWQAALVAASVVLADHGSVGLYAAALDKPVLLAGGDAATTVPGSATAELAAVAPTWNGAGDLRESIDLAIGRHAPGAYATVTRLLVEPGTGPDDCARRLRGLLYELLGLAEPVSPAQFAPLMIPTAAQPPTPAHVVGATVTADAVRIQRFADLGHGRPHDALPYRHLTADLRSAGIGQLSAAAILTTGADAMDDDLAARELARWPQARLVAATDGHTCTVWSRNGVTIMRAAAVDPLVLASLAYVRLATAGRIPERDRVELGGRIIAVDAAER